MVVLYLLNPIVSDDKGVGRYYNTVRVNNDAGRCKHRPERRQLLAGLSYREKTTSKQ